MSDNTKVVAALLIGAAVGAAVGYFIASTDKEEALNNIEDSVTNIKEKFLEHMEKGRAAVNNVADKVEELLNTNESSS